MYLKDNVSKYKKVEEFKTNSPGYYIKYLVCKAIAGIITLALAVVLAVLFVKIVSPIILTFIK